MPATRKAKKSFPKESASAKARKAAKPKASAKKPPSKKPARIALKGASRTVKAPKRSTAAKTPRKTAEAPKAAAESVRPSTAKPVVVKLKLGPLRQVKDDLLKRRGLLLKNLGRLTATATEISDKPVGDRADDAAIDLEVNSSYTLVEHETEELRLIDVALEKVTNGTYGICEECNKPIEKPRLTALPYAGLCLKCKQAEETSRVETSQVDYSDIDEE